MLCFSACSTAKWRYAFFVAATHLNPAPGARAEAFVGEFIAGVISWGSLLAFAVTQVCWDRPEQLCAAMAWALATSVTCGIVGAARAAWLEGQPPAAIRFAIGALTGAVIGVVFALGAREVLCVDAPLPPPLPLPLLAYLAGCLAFVTGVRALVHGD